MGFLSEPSELVGWLRSAAISVRALEQREYQDIVKRWREQFEPMFYARAFVTGTAAEQAVRAALPADVFVFSLPGYRFLPSGTDPQLSPAYGYEVKTLSEIDFGTANRADAIFTDPGMTITLVCTHEAGELADPIFAGRG